MRRVLVGLLFWLTIVCVLASAASAATPPSVSTSFSPSTVSIGGTTELTFTLGGGDGAFGDIGIWASFPTGLNVAASSSSQCGGTLTAIPAPDVTPLPGGGALEVRLSGASLATGGSCSFSVPVTAESAGQLTVGTSVAANNRSQGYGYGTTAVLTVPAIAAPPTVTSAFTPSTVTENGTTTWKVQIANPNTSATLTGVRFFVEMPVTTAYIVPEALTGTGCGGIGIPDGGLDPHTLSSPSVNYGGGSIAPGAKCVITVIMSPENTFSQVPLPVTVLSNEGGESAVSNATLTSLAPPTTSVPDPTPVPDPIPTPSRTPSNTFPHTKPKVARNGTITETVKLPGAGTVRLRETWRGKLIAHVHKTVETSQKLTIKLVPSAAARRVLKSRRAATLKLSVAYTAAGGQTRTAKLSARTRR